MSNKKKILVSLIITLMLLTITIVSNAASDGVITGETVKLREEPSMDGSLVTLLSVDNKVEVLGKDGEWYHIKYKNYEGYVYQDYVDVEDEVENETNTTNSTSNTSSENEVSENNTTSNETTNTTSESKETQTEENQSEQTNENIIGKEKIVSENVELKILPLINSDVLGNIKMNATVTVQDEINDWVYVYTNDLAGWIRKDKLADKKSDNSSKEEEKENLDENKDESYTAYVDASSVNVREKASSSSEVVTTLSTNEKVTVESVEKGWAKVKTEDGTKGYISNEYLSKEKVKVTNRSGDVERPTITKQTSTENKKTSSKSNNSTSKSSTTSKSDKKTTSSSSSSNKGTQVVSYAKKYLGASYVYGGDGPNSFDCSGFTQYVYKKFGVSLPHSASAQQSYGKAVSKSNLKQGDLVFFTGHVGIYVGNNKFIHAANPSKGVVITSLSDSYYKKNYITARRIF